MANDISEFGSTIGSALGGVVREVADSIGSDGNGNGLGGLGQSGGGPFSGARGVAVGATLAAAVPLAGRAVKSAVSRRGSEGESDEGGSSRALPGAGSLKGLAAKAKSTVAEGAKGAVDKKIEAEGGASEVAKEAGKKMLPGLPGFGGKDEEGKAGQKGIPGVGKGRRMPVQQAVDIGVPISVAYNQWTQFEEWPEFMHRLDQATQEDDCTVSFRTKIWGMSKEFEGHIVEQRPDERIQWTVEKGVSHTGVVTFHELAPNLTRVQVSLDIEPGSLIEKMARGMRYVKRAVRADLARFKAFIEIQEVETGAWRGVVHDGEVVKQHDSKYDRGREYSDLDDIKDKESSHGAQSKTNSGGAQEQQSRTAGARTRKASSSHKGSRSRPKRPRKPAARRGGASGSKK